ncbi:hypothetical protein Rhal01_02497 [Rubritalea halochordaticola]|uniref:Uncharacterized protein n=1 Tax=Rubritalea halochordaticola TaxID=714537 RepID=A0ABP9V308_9BACT
MNIDCVDGDFSSNAARIETVLLMKLVMELC